MGTPVNNFARIQTTDGKVNYRLTPDDVLWSARAASREGVESNHTLPGETIAQEAARVLWTFTQRFVLYDIKAGLTYLQVLRSFSQPVNPIWAANGAMCKPGGKYHGTDYCSAARLAARDKAASATWDQLQAEYPVTLAVIAKWSAGELANPVPRVTNFSAAAVAKSYLAKNPDSTLFSHDGGNWYIMDPTPAKWPNNYVSMEPPTPGSSLLSNLWQGATAWWKA